MLDNVQKIIDIIIPLIIKIIPLVAAIFALIALLYGFIKFVEFIARKEINHPDTIKKLSGIIRPSVIFTSKEVVIADQGGLGFIKTITVNLDKEDKHNPREIIIKFNKFMPLQPILTSLSAFQFHSEASRGKDFSWVFPIDPYVTTPDIDHYVFRVEILN